MKKQILSVVGVALLAGPTVASAALVSSPEFDLEILGEQYAVTFWQDASGMSAAGQIATLPITFATADSALTAADALWQAVNRTSFDYEPGDPFASGIFGVFYAFDPTEVLGYTCGRTSGCRSVVAGFDQAYTGSFAIFRPTSVPEPGTFALLGLGLAGIGFGAARRRRPI